MKNFNFVIWLVFLVFALLLGISLIGKNLGITGQTSGGIAINNGTVLSAIAAVFAIGVLIVSGFQQTKAIEKRSEENKT
jgi:hypothetical protein